MNETVQLEDSFKDKLWEVADRLRKEVTIENKMETKAAIHGNQKKALIVFTKIEVTENQIQFAHLTNEVPE